MSNKQIEAFLRGLESGYDKEADDARRLFEAAPKLLAALKAISEAYRQTLVEEFSRDAETSEEWVAAQAAIAEAEGE